MSFGLRWWAWHEILSFTMSAGWMLARTQDEEWILYDLCLTQTLLIEMHVDGMRRQKTRFPGNDKYEHAQSCQVPEVCHQAKTSLTDTMSLVGTFFSLFLAGGAYQSFICNIRNAPALTRLMSNHLFHSLYRVTHFWVTVYFFSTFLYFAPNTKKYWWQICHMQRRHCV